MNRWLVWPALLALAQCAPLTVASQTDTQVTFCRLRGSPDTLQTMETAAVAHCAIAGRIPRLTQAVDCGAYYEGSRYECVKE